MSACVPPVQQSFSIAMANNMFFSFLFLFFFLLPFAANSINFQKTRFYPDDTDILYQGDAVPNSVGAIELNRVHYFVRVGWATYAQRIRIWDSDSGRLSNFVTHFSFTIDPEGRNASDFGDGLSFFLAPFQTQIVPNSPGFFLGLFNTSTSQYSSRNQIVSVEFDTHPDDLCDDPPYHHVGINVNSLYSAATVPWNATFHGGDTGDAWITYNATTKNLSVSWIYKRTSIAQENSGISYQIDLTKVLPEWVMVGFSAATGKFIERHVIESWEFSSSLDIEETNAIKNKKQMVITVGVGLSVSACIVIAAALAAFVILRRRNRIRREAAERFMKLRFINDDLERGAGPRRYLRRDLVSATNNFSNDRKLGEGGFGAVYKGYLFDIDMPIAVKKVSSGSKQGEKEYITEVKIFSRLRHRNLVQLMGWCHDSGEFLLVYEFMPNGSLDSHLFGRKSPLTWAVRYRVALGLASALLYLHEEWEQCVVHRDIKSSNIMLDSSFNVKLGDFGLARLMDHEVGPQTTGVAGTFGCLAPEYVSTGRASKESDVFSFGIVALEVTTGRKSVNPIERNNLEEMGLVEWVWDLYGGGKLLLAADEKLQHLGFDEKQVECLMIVGLWCAHPDHTLRPSIRQALQVLNFEAAMPNLPEKMPALMYHVPAPPPAPSANSGEPFLTSSSMEVGR